MNRILSKFEIRKIKWAVKLKKKFSKSSDEVTQRIGRYNVSFYGYNSLRILFNEIFLENDYYFETKKQSPLIIDCGANVGMSVIYFKTLYPDSSIIAFEPSPHAFELLKKNVEQNNLKNVTLHNTALSSEEGELTFYVGDSKGSLSSSLNPSRGGNREMKVQVERLSSIIGDQKPDLVKIDVEGAEWGVLKDLIDTDTIKNADQYRVEYHHMMEESSNANFSEFLNYFEQNGFGYNIKSGFSKYGSFQDIFLSIFRTK